MRSQSFKLLCDFTEPGIGAIPASGVVLIGKTLFGTALNGGDLQGSGTVYTVDIDATTLPQPIFTFYQLESHPSGAFVISDNMLYTTGEGGTANAGSIITVSLDGDPLPLNWYDFTPASGDGRGPDGLIMAGSLLYGVTHSGGRCGYGTIYAYDGRTVTNLYSFSGTNGANPNGSLLLYNGSFYGVTRFGGTSSNGTVYSINVDGSGFKTLHNFSGSTNGEGANPMAGLILLGGTFYGTTFAGGIYGTGTVFSISIDGTTFKTLHSFRVQDGANPAAALNLSGNTLYGTTKNGGAYNRGTAFAVRTDGAGFTSLHSFNGEGGANPIGQLFFYSNTLYGTTLENTALGLDGGLGTVFSIWLGNAAPQLSIKASNENVVVTWPATNGLFFLQSATGVFSAPVWTNVYAPVSVINGLNTVTDSISQAQQFYRLSQ